MEINCYRYRYIDKLHYVIYNSKILRRFIKVFEKVSISKGYDYDILLEVNPKCLLLNSLHLSP